MKFTKAHEELDKHRGWSELLINLLIGISTLGTGILIKGAINYRNNKHFLFVHETKSDKKLQKAESDITEMVEKGINPKK